MPRPRSDNPSPGALRMRKLRERKEPLTREQQVELMETAQARHIAKASQRTPEASRLVCVPVWVPRGDEKVIQTTAARLRKAARIPDSEAPE